MGAVVFAVLDNLALFMEVVNDLVTFIPALQEFALKHMNYQVLFRMTG